MAKRGPGKVKTALSTRPGLSTYQAKKIFFSQCAKAVDEVDKANAIASMYNLPVHAVVGYPDPQSAGFGVTQGRPADQQAKYGKKQKENKPYKLVLHAPSPKRAPAVLKRVQEAMGDATVVHRDALPDERPALVSLKRKRLTAPDLSPDDVARQLA